MEKIYLVINIGKRIRVIKEEEIKRHLIKRVVI